MSKTIVATSPNRRWLLTVHWILSMIFAVTGLRVANNHSFEDDHTVASAVDGKSNKNNTSISEYNYCLPSAICVVSLIGLYGTSQNRPSILSLACIACGLLTAQYSTYLSTSLLTIGCLSINPLLQSSCHRTFQFNGIGSLIHLLAHAAEKVDGRVNDYIDLYHPQEANNNNNNRSTEEEGIARRQKQYQLMVDSFYDLVTDFYEYGWGQSFHFAPRYIGESFLASLTRAEHFVALKARLGSDSKVLDMGCGVGGPLRSIAHLTKATIHGITINQYQVDVANKYIEQDGLEKTCRVLQGDFMKLPFADNTFDAIYAIESLCHAPDKAKCLQEAKRVLKPGGILVAYDWVMLGNYAESNRLHVQLREGIEIGNGLPSIPQVDSVVRALKETGFDILDHFDPNAGQHDTKHEIPWYATLKGSWSFNGFRMTSLGRSCTHGLLAVLEMLKIAPKGSTKVSQILNRTADDLVKAGELGIFSPSYFYQVQKPM